MIDLDVNNPFLKFKTSFNRLCARDGFVLKSNMSKRRFSTFSSKESMYNSKRLRGGNKIFKKRV